MSYILDALKQSDRQRKREPAPDRAMAAVMARPRQSGGAGRKWRLPLLALVAVAGGLAWWQWGFKDSLQSTAPSANASGQPAVPAGQASVVAQIEASKEMRPTLNSEDLKGVRIQLEDRVVEPVAPAPTTGTPPVVADSDSDRKAGRSEVEGVQSPEPEMAAKANPWANVPYWRQLPVDVQRSLPELTFSVHIYSEDPASRRVKIGERMMREGQRITPQVRLEEIIPKGVILSYQEYRFRMNAL